MARAALREPAPRVTLVLRRTVEKVGSMLILSLARAEGSDLRLFGMDSVIDDGLVPGPRGSLNFV
jgi:hypothetical protein